MSERPYDEIMADLTWVTDRIGAGEEGLGELQESLIREMNDHSQNLASSYVSK